MIEIIKNTNIDFMGKKKIALALSAVIVLLGIFSIIQISLGNANMGVDFAGGTAVQIKFTKNVPLHDVRGALEGAGLKDFDLQDLVTENKVLIRVKKQDEKVGGYSEKITSVLAERFADMQPVVDSTTDIGPKVGAKLRNDAVWAVFMSVIGILGYIAWRFQFRFGVGATIATMHDVLFVLAVFYLLGKEINLIVISALLTIAGYSLTDTVVIFDRIRENIKRYVKDSMEAVINRSINEVLSRTIVTSLTVFFSALALYLFGGEVIHDFALAMLLGVIVGTYSSVFIASPIAMMLKKSTGTAIKK